MKKAFSLLGATLFLVGSISTSVILSNKEEVYTPSFATYSNGDADIYYKGISDTETGEELLSSLQTLNSRRRQKTVGYNAMGTSASGQFKYTDYDPDTIKYDSSNQPYGEKILSFYSGNSTKSFNREHVWPNSHGGNKVEADIHMTRPTIPSENGSRGNSFYVEGMKDPSKGWDPAMEDFGQEDYRGDSARIIFYCVVADKALSLIDDSYHQTSSSKRDNLMGKLSDMIKWHLTYPVHQREKNRNEGAEYLQGNRNPFIDHPEYVCRIWGNTNAATRALCANDPYDTHERIEPTYISLNMTTASIEIDETVQLSVASVVPENAETSVNWVSSNKSVATVSDKGLVTGVGEGEARITAVSNYNSSVNAECVVTVKNPQPPVDDKPTGIALDKTNEELKIGDTIQLNATYLPSNEVASDVSWQSSNDSIATVSDTGLVTAIAEGSANITVTSVDGSLSATCVITVKPNSSGESGDDNGGGSGTGGDSGSGGDNGGTDSGGDSGGSDANEQPEKISVSCGGNIIATSVILSSVALVGAILLIVKNIKKINLCAFGKENKKHK